MNAEDRRKLSALLIFSLPVMAWIFSARKLDYIHKGHLIKGLYYAAISTPHSFLLITAPVVGLSFAIALIWFLHRINGTEFTGAKYRRFLRGAELVSIDKLKRITAHKKNEQISLAGVPVPLKIESYHFLIGGSTGAGKSVAIREMAYKAFMRNDKLIFTDPSGDMLSKFYKKGDKILNPYDQRTEGWSFFNEIRNDFDFKRYALSVVPRGKTSEAEEWAGYGRLLLAETAKKLVLIGDPSIESLYRLTTIEDPQKLKAFLSGTLAESLFVGAEKALASARFVLSSKLPEHVSMPSGNFSIRDWLNDDTGGNLFLTWREDMAESLKPLISAWVDTICTSVLSMEESRDRRIWLFLDELASLEKLASLESALTKGRKAGLRVVAGLQSTAQLDDTYGRDTAQVLRSCFRSMAVLGGARTDAKTREDFSNSLGDHEVEREQISTTSGMRGSTNVAIRPIKERVVLASELATLPELTGYLAFAGDYPISRFKLDVLRLKNRIVPFEERTLNA